MGNIFTNAADWLNETFLDKDNLEFDTDNLRSSSTVISKTAGDLRSAEKTLTASIDGLRDTWKTGASKAFFEKYDTEWSSQLSSYFDMLDALAGALNYAATTYDSVKI